MQSSLETLDLTGSRLSPHKFTGGIPPEWSSLANLKELKMAYCGLDGTRAGLCPADRAQKEIDM